MMLLARNDETNHHIRYELHVDKFGIRIEYLRSMVGGGWYVRDHQSFPWPWTKLT